MKLIPKRKLLPMSYPDSIVEITTENINEVINNFNNTLNNSIGNTYYTNTYMNEITQTIVGAVISTLDDILDGTLYGKVLQTNLSSNALKIITAQSALLDLIPADTATSDLGSDTKEWLLGYIQKCYMDTRCVIPVGTDMYD